MYSNLAHLPKQTLNFTNHSVSINYKTKYMENKNIELFETKPIRKVWHNEEWFFSLIDVIEVLTDSPTPHTYWEKLKKRELQLSPFWG